MKPSQQINCQIEPLNSYIGNSPSTSSYRHNR
jgi:hypothetical protein